MSKVIDAEYVEISEDTAIAVFDGKVKLSDVLDGVTNAARALAKDSEADTAIGRKEIAAIAYKVARTKTLIDGKGKEIVEVWKNQAKVVDAQRKDARARLDALRDEIRKPVTDWEDEQKRIQEEAMRKEQEEAAARLADIERREAELKAKEDAARAKEEAEQQEKARIEREARLVAEAEQRARVESKDRERAAIAAKEAAERNADLAAYRAEQAKKQAEQDAKDAVEREKARVKAEKDAEEAAAKAREADKAHKAAINNAAAKAFTNAGLPTDLAKIAVAEIARGNVPNVAIRY